jgi:hypothetical protein
MKKCLTCKNDLNLHYGDNIYGDNFCKDCYEKHRCLHCNKMNIDILFDRFNNVSEILIKRKYGGTVCNSSILSNIFEPGYKFELYCEVCWDRQEMYKDDDNQSVEPEEDDLDYDYDEEDEDSEEFEYSNDYHLGKGKYDLY